MTRRILCIGVVFLLATGFALRAYQEKAGEVKKTPEADKDIARPVLIEKVTPKYPEDAKKEKVQGAVKLDIIIGTDGGVVEAKAIESPDDRLTAAAIDAVKQWKFKPAKGPKGNPVQVKSTVTMAFRLK